MSSPLAEAFLLVTLNNCYETPSNNVMSCDNALQKYVQIYSQPNFEFHFQT